MDKYLIKHQKSSNVKYRSISSQFRHASLANPLNGRLLMPEQHKLDPKVFNHFLRQAPRPHLL